jgi:hypothetical protein
MKPVLIATNTLGKWGETNGVEYTYNSLLQEFMKHGYPIEMVCYGPHDCYEKYGNAIIRTHSIPSLLDIHVS